MQVILKHALDGAIWSVHTLTEGGGGGRFMSIHFSVTAKLLQNETHCCFGVQHATECGTRTDKALHIILPKLRNKEST